MSYPGNTVHLFLLVYENLVGLLYLCNLGPGHAHLGYPVHLFLLVYKDLVGLLHLSLHHVPVHAGLEKTRVLKKKPSPVGFFVFFLFFLGFLNFFGFFWVFCPDERVFRVYGLQQAFFIERGLRSTRDT